MDTQPSATRSPSALDIRVFLAVLALTILGGALRVVALDLGPESLYRDEAQNGLDALQVIGGQRAVFFEANNGREPLHIYLLAVSIALFGRSPDALRLVSVITGTLTIPALYWLGRELYGIRVGLLAATLAVSTVWLLSLSFVAFRVGLLPLLSSLGLAAAWRAQRLRSSGWAVAGGVLLGLCLYTYLAARLIPLALGGYLLWCLLDRRTRSGAWCPGWVTTTAIAALVVWPLVLYLIETGNLLSRSEQVSILSAEINRGDLWGTLAANVGRTLRSLAYGGDFIPRHNVPWRAVFTPALAVAAYAGLGWQAWRARREPASRLMLVWLVVLVIPTILAENAPHYLRGAGALPAVMLLPALGIEGVLTHVRDRWRAPAAALVVLAIAWGAWSDWRAFRQHLASDAVYYQFETSAAEMAAEINRHLGSGWQGSERRVTEREPIAGHEVWVARRLWEKFPSVEYLVSSPERVVLLMPDAAGLEAAPESGPLPAAPSEALLALLWPYEKYGALFAGLPEHWSWELSEGAWEQGDLEPEPRLLYLALRGEPAREWRTSHGVRFDDGVTLLAVRVEPVVPNERPGDATVEASDVLGLVLRWRADSRPSAGYNAFVHVICAGAQVGQSDGPVAGEQFPTDAWRVGDVIVDRRDVPLSAAYDPATCQTHVGLYRWQDLERLAVLDGGGHTVLDDAVVLQDGDLRDE